MDEVSIILGNDLAGERVVSCPVVSSSKQKSASRCPADEVWKGVHHVAMHVKL